MPEENVKGPIKDAFKALIADMIANPQKYITLFTTLFSKKPTTETVFGAAADTPELVAAQEACVDCTEEEVAQAVQAACEEIQASAAD